MVLYLGIYGSADIDIFRPTCHNGVQAWRTDLEDSKTDGLDMLLPQSPHIVLPQDKRWLCFHDELIWLFVLMPRSLSSVHTLLRFCGISIERTSSLCVPLPETRPCLSSCI